MYVITLSATKYYIIRQGHVMALSVKIIRGLYQAVSLFHYQVILLHYQAVIPLTGEYYINRPITLFRRSRYNQVGIVYTSLFNNRVPRRCHNGLNWFWGSQMTRTASGPSVCWCYVINVQLSCTLSWRLAFVISWHADLL